MQTRARRYADSRRLSGGCEDRSALEPPTPAQWPALPTDSLAKVDLQRRIVSRQGAFLLFALTPPRLSSSAEQAQELADVTLERLEPLGLDGLILYDIDDESDRNPDERPFPYLPTMDPAEFHAEHLGAWERPVVIYRCVGKYAEDDLRDWLGEADPAQVLGVFVGASSGSKAVRTNLRRAQ